MARRRLLGDPRAVWRGFIRLTAPREAALRAQLQKEFGRVAALAEATVRDGRDVDTVLNGHAGRVQVLLRGAYSNVMPAAGLRILDAAVGKAAKDLFEELVVEWIKTYSARKVTAISATTRDQLRRTLVQAHSEGMGAAAAARYVRRHMGGVLSRARSLTIARTETHSAANAAQELAAESTGRDDMRREWIAAEDERTREDHVFANGQVVRMGEPFQVGGAELMYPGDPAGPAEQIINCRCVVGMLIER